MTFVEFCELRMQTLRKIGSAMMRTGMYPWRLRRIIERKYRRYSYRDEWAYERYEIYLKYLRSAA